MAFTLEDGTGVASSNAYIDIAFADTYHADRGHTAWAGVTVAVTDAQKQAAIIRATDHIERTFGAVFRGYKKTDAQGLGWPRTDAISPNEYTFLGVPDELQRATAEYAIRALLYGVLTPDPAPHSQRQSLIDGETLATYGEASGDIELIRDKVGPIESEVRYGKKHSNRLDSYPAADMMLRPLLIPRNSAKIMRG